LQLQWVKYAANKQEIHSGNETFPRPIVNFLTDGQGLGKLKYCKLINYKYKLKSILK